MNIHAQVNNGTATISLSGRFDFNSNRPFREACEGALGNPQTKQLDLDLEQVEYMDSSALGMLLLLRESAAGYNKPVSLSGSRGTVRQILDIAHFGRLFKMT